MALQLVQHRRLTLQQRAGQNSYIIGAKYKEIPKLTRRSKTNNNRDPLLSLTLGPVITGNGTRVLAGDSSKNIAADPGISQRTVENHRAAITTKPGSKTLLALARLVLAASSNGAD
jgi:FixJ family two-component response regulator